MMMLGLLLLLLMMLRYRCRRNRAIIVAFTLLVSSTTTINSVPGCSELHLILLLSKQVLRRLRKSLRLPNVHRLRPVVESQQVRSSGVSIEPMRAAVMVVHVVVAPVRSLAVRCRPRRRVGVGAVCRLACALANGR